MFALRQDFFIFILKRFRLALPTLPFTSSCEPSVDQVCQLDKLFPRYCFLDISFSSLTSCFSILCFQHRVSFPEMKGWQNAGYRRIFLFGEAGLEKSGRIVAFCDWNARFCDQKTWCSRNFAPKTRRPGASLRPDEHSSRSDSENKN